MQGNEKDTFSYCAAFKSQRKRRKQGTRHSFENIYVIVILSTMNGYIGYRGMEDFMIRFKTELESVLKSPTHGLPSYSSIRRVMQHTHFNIVSSIFNRWIRSQVKLKKGSGRMQMVRVLRVLLQTAITSIKNLFQ
ncbi:MAG: transposase family protein [Bacteroidetes bacterium]|nr:transposase family protein [Bacteroidota bacterium]